MEYSLFKIANNANPQLDAAISAASTTFALKTGHGVLLPTIITGSATSEGTTNLLITTAASNISIGDYIYNSTDGSHAIVLAKDGNNVTTTKLQGGSGNTWGNGDQFMLNRMVATLTKYDSDNVITQQERVLIVSHGASADSVVVERSYGGDTALEFDPDDYLYLMVEASVIDGITNAVKNAYQEIRRLEYHEDGIPTTTGSSNAYAVTTTIPINSLDELENKKLLIKLNHTCTGACTLNVNGLGVKNIKKFDGNNDIASGDLRQNQYIEVQYDGTQFHLLSPVGQLPDVGGGVDFGEGGDGSYTLDGTQATVSGVFEKVDSSNYKLLKDCEFDTLTINSGITLNTNGYTLRCLTELANNGVVSVAGGDGSNGQDNTITYGTVLLGGAAGTRAYTTGTLPVPPASGDGGNGGFYSGGATQAEAGDSGSNLTSFALLGDGVAGGGGASATSSGGAAGAAGTGTCTEVEKAKIYSNTRLIETLANHIQGYAGSGGGGGGGYRLYSGNYVSGGGGGGAGANGGFFDIYATTVSGTGEFTVAGGNGGNGGEGVATGPYTAGGGGGGGGGNGGVGVIVSENITFSGTYTIDGGTGGTGGTGFATGTNGADGKDGAIFTYIV